MWPGHVSAQNFPLGATWCQGKLLSADPKYRRSRIPIIGRDARRYRRMWSTHGHEVSSVCVVSHFCSTHIYLLLLSKKEAINTDNWTWPMRMMDAMITGLEQSLVGFT